MSKNKIRFVLLALLVLVALCAGYAYYETRNIIEVEYIYRNKYIPDSFVGKKIIFITDTHSGANLNGADMEQLVARINDRKPDIVVLGGDYVLLDSVYSAPFFAALSKIESTYGTYYVLGNHDHWAGALFFKENFSKIGVADCNNKSYWIKEGNDSIKIGGVDDLWEGKQLIDATIDDVDNQFTILLSHNPDYMEVINESDADKIDLVLAGHNHGGQVTLFGLYAPILPAMMHNDSIQSGQKYRYGWVHEKGVDIYITAGIGTDRTIPVRFFAPPEIVEITLSQPI